MPPKSRSSKGRGRAKQAPARSNFFRGEILGSGLVLLSIIVLLSLASSNRGSFTGIVINFLTALFGVGVWGVPLLLLVVGVWLALRDVAEPGRFGAGRIAGLIGLFLAVEGFIHLFAGQPDPFAPLTIGRGGGIAGWGLSQAAVGLLGMPAGVAALLLLAFLSVVGLAGRTLVDVFTGIGAVWARLRERPDDVASLPPLPTTNGRGTPALPFPPEFAPQPWYRRAWRRLFPERHAGMEPFPIPPGSGPIVTTGASPAGPTATAGAAYDRPTLRNGQPAPLPAPPQGAAAPGAGSRGSGFTPQPRIIGGQTWRLPALPEVLEENTDLDIQQDDVRKRIQIIETTLAGFGVPVSVAEVNQGPAVTQFGLKPGVIVRKDRKGEEKHVKVRVSQIQALSNDLSLALSASPIRIEAPVPGRDFVGVEVPNVQISMVSLRGVMEAEEWAATKGMLKFGLGRDVSGQASVSDLARMPHLLVAGATGSGKSVCINAIISSLLLTHTPDSLRFLMIDPKRVELTVYNGIPHLIAPVVVDVERAVPVLQWATREMERRYKAFAKAGARNIDGFNEKQLARGEQTLPYIVILIDELADLMLSAPEEVERYICRIAQMARATGMHLVLATQRPSVDVVTGLIKANFPARIAFAVTSQIDSRVILDTPGAEQLLGRGDMLFMAPDTSKLLRLQGCFVSDRETYRLVQYWKGARTFSDLGTPLADVPDAGDVIPGAEPPPDWMPPGRADGMATDDRAPGSEGFNPPWLPGQEELTQPLWNDILNSGRPDRDEMYVQAVEEVRKVGRASTSLLQRRLRIGYSRAARLIEQLEADGVVGPDPGGTRGREVLPPK
jgi:DNA segregation ATPase FtsK/SpoIIIE, S-DNA-T family